MAPVPHHDDPVRELESVQGDGQAAHLMRQLHHQARAAAALRRSLSALSGDVSPKQAYRAQTTESVWRELEREFGLLTATEVGQLVGSTARSAKSFASDAHRSGRLLAERRLNKLLDPAFQLTGAGPLPVVRDLRRVAQRLEVGGGVGPAVAHGVPGDVAVHPDLAMVRAFAFPKDLDWLTRLLAPLNVAITGP